MPVNETWNSGKYILLIKKYLMKSNLKQEISSSDFELMVILLVIILL